jgi:hypothetical protein
MTQDTKAQGRRVTANISLSLDGRVNGRGGDHDMGWVVPHNVTEATRDFMVRMTDSATTVLLGRKNYEGFGGYWPAVAEDESSGRSSTPTNSTGCASSSARSWSVAAPACSPTAGSPPRGPSLTCRPPSRARSA